jgi:hypothetical protein
MTRVANAVIVTNIIPDQGSDFFQGIVGKVFERADGCQQSFNHIPINGAGDREYLDTLAGGSVFFESEVFAAAFNHVEPEVVADWFEGLPWEQWDTASLTIHGNDSTVFVLVVDGQPRRTTTDS